MLRDARGLQQQRSDAKRRRERADGMAVAGRRRRAPAERRRQRASPGWWRGLVRREQRSREAKPGKPDGSLASHAQRRQKGALRAQCLLGGAKRLARGTKAVVATPRARQSRGVGRTTSMTFAGGENENCETKPRASTRQLTVPSDAESSPATTEQSCDAERLLATKTCRATPSGAPAAIPFAAHGRVACRKHGKGRRAEKPPRLPNGPRTQQKYWTRPDGTSLQ